MGFLALILFPLLFLYQVNDSIKEGLVQIPKPNKCAKASYRGLDSIFSIIILESEQKLMLTNPIVKTAAYTVFVKTPIFFLSHMYFV